MLTSTNVHQENFVIQVQMVISLIAVLEITVLLKQLHLKTALKEHTKMKPKHQRWKVAFHVQPEGPVQVSVQHQRQIMSNARQAITAYLVQPEQHQ